MEKIGINIVGVGPSCDDVSTQLLNISGGFRGVTGKIVSRDTDSLYLGITSDRAYIVTVEGDLSLSTETSDSIGSKTAGVTGFDIDWTLTAKQFGNGSGKIIVTNPDAPSEVSTFEVFMGEPRSVVVEFAANTGCVESAICDDFWASHLLVGSRNWSPLGDLDVVGHELAKPDRLAYFGDFNEFGHEPFGDSLAMLLPLLDATALDRVFDHPSFEKPGMSAFLVSDGEPSGFSPNYHRPQDVLPRDGDIAVVRASIEDLMASYGNDSDAAIEVGSETRDFDQLKRTRSNDLERIEQAVVKANALGIDTSNVASRRDAALAKLSVFSDRFESGGTREVTAAEAEVISQVFGELWGIHSDLDTLVSHWHHYKQHEANHDTWEQRLADRKRNFKVADDAADNRIATSYVTYAANPEETLAASKAAFVELFQAIQRGDLRAAHQADTRARQFSTREHLLDALVRRGKLVVVEDNSTVA